MSPLTFQELVRALDPLVDVVLVFHFQPDDVRAGFVAWAEVEERTRLGKRQRREQVDEEHDEQEHQETAHILVNLLLCSGCCWCCCGCG